MINALSNLIVVGLSAALLWHFSNIWRYGSYTIGEPNITILTLETGGIFLLMLFGLTRIIVALARPPK